MRRIKEQRLGRWSARLTPCTGQGQEQKKAPSPSASSSASSSVSLSNGTRVTGVVKIYLPQGRDRLSDYARVNEQFRYLEAPGKTFIVNMAHIVELSETAGS